MHDRGGVQFDSSARTRAGGFQKITGGGCHSLRCDAVNFVLAVFHSFRVDRKDNGSAGGRLLRTQGRLRRRVKIAVGERLVVVGHMGCKLRGGKKKGGGSSGNSSDRHSIENIGTITRAHRDAKNI